MAKVAATKSKNNVPADTNDEVCLSDLSSQKEQYIKQFTERLGRCSNATTVINQILLFAEYAPLEELLSALQEDAVSRGDASRYKDVLATALRIIQLKEMPYSEYLKTSYWHELATYTKKQFGGRCALDESHVAENAHHRTYVRRGREHMEDLIPLCSGCHTKFHKG